MTTSASRTTAPRLRSTVTALYGIAYNPTWTTWSPPYANNGGQAQFSDADFFNDSFNALWASGNDANNSYRNDLATIANTGFHLLRLYNWGPTRGWTGSVGTAHLNFLDYANTLDLQVVVPISNYFLSDDTYAWNGQNPDATFAWTSAPVAIQTALLQFLSSVTTSTSVLHPAVHSFAVGNEIDLNTLVGQGSSTTAVSPSSRLARTLWWIVNLRAQLLVQNLGSSRFTSPISNADQGAAGSGSYWFGAFVSGVTASQTALPDGTAGGTGTTFDATVTGLSSYTWAATEYYNSVNMYQTGTQLAATLGQYDNWTAQNANNLNWPGQQFTVPLMLTEIGNTRTDNSASGQEAQFSTVTTAIADVIATYLGNTPSSLLQGYCLYEFSDEIYLGSAQAGFGLYMVETSQYPNGNVLYLASTGTTNVSYGAWPSTTYPVDALVAVQGSSGQTLAAALAKIFNGGQEIKKRAA